MPNTRARQLRWDMTDDERRLWSLLRRKQLAGYRFRRQHPMGPYIADFFCANVKLIVELDGGQHSEDKQMYRDEIRTRWLASRGYRVLRIWNNDLKQRPNDILDMIVDALQHPLPALRATFPLKAGLSHMKN